jgi:WD40 repeat protein
MLDKNTPLVVIITLCVCSVNAQTRSNCRTSFQLGPNVKPGVSGTFTLTRDGKTLVVPSVDGRIRFIDLESGEIKRSISGHSNYVNVATFSPDGKLLASSSRDNTARIWDLATGQEVQKFASFRCSVKPVAFSPDGRTLAASGNDGMLKIWDVKTAKELKSLVHRDSPDIDMATYAFVFSKNGKQIFAGNGDGTISIWDVETGKEIRNWKAHENTTLKLLLSSDYRRLISFGDAVVKVWDTSTWRELQTFPIPKTAGASAMSSTVALSHNEKLIAASDVEVDSKQNTYLSINTVVWNAKTGEKLFTLSGHRLDINGLIFTPDDRFLLTGSADTTINFWDMSNGKLTRTITIR